MILLGYLDKRLFNCYSKWNICVFTSLPGIYDNQQMWTAGRPVKGTHRYHNHRPAEKKKRDTWWFLSLTTILTMNFANFNDTSLDSLLHLHLICLALRNVWGFFYFNLAEISFTKVKHDPGKPRPEISSLSFGQLKTLQLNHHPPWALGGGTEENKSAISMEITVTFNLRLTIQSAPWLWQWPAVKIQLMLRRWIVN